MGAGEEKRKEKQERGMKKKQEGEGRLNDVTLDLLELLDINVSPDGGSSPSNGQDSSSSNDHVSLGVSVGTVDGVSGWGSDSEGGLDVDVCVDGGEVCLGLLWEVLSELLWEDVLPDGGSDGGSNGATDGGEHALDGENYSDVLMRGGGHGNHLFANDAGTAGEGNKDLAHDDEADVDSGLAEVGHEADTEDGDGDSEPHGEPLDAAGPANEETDDEGRETGTDGVDVANVRGVGDGLVLDDDEEGEKVGVPAVERDKEGTGEDTGAEDGAVEEELVWDESDGGEVAFPEDESDDEETSESDQADDQWGLPLVLLSRVDVEGEKEHGETSDDEEKSKGIKLNGVVLDGLHRSTSRWGSDDETSLLSLLVVVPEEEEQWESDSWSDNRPDTETPAETGSVENVGSERSTNPGSGNIWRRGIGQHETSVLERRSIGNEDTKTVGKTVVTVGSMLARVFPQFKSKKTYPTQ